MVVVIPTELDHGVNNEKIVMYYIWQRKKIEVKKLRKKVCHFFNKKIYNLIIFFKLMLAIRFGI